MLEEVTHLTWDVVCFSETRAPTDDVILHGGHRLLTSRGTAAHEGVAVLLHARLADLVKRVHCISGRLMYVDLADTVDMIFE